MNRAKRMELERKSHRTIFMASASILPAFVSVATGQWWMLAMIPFYLGLIFWHRRKLRMLKRK